jgi:hypothetical protein
MAAAPVFYISPDPRQRRGLSLRDEIPVYGMLRHIMRLHIAANEKEGNRFPSFSVKDFTAG